MNISQFRTVSGKVDFLLIFIVVALVACVVAAFAALAYQDYQATLLEFPVLSFDEPVQVVTVPSELRESRPALNS